MPEELSKFRIYWVMGILPLALAGLALLILSVQNDVKRKDREGREALQLEGEIRSEALLALTADEKYEDYCPHHRACYNIAACDLTDEIYRAAWEAGIAPYAFLNIMSISDDADDAEEWARQRKVYQMERMRTEGLDGCVYNYPRTVDAKQLWGEQGR